MDGLTELPLWIVISVALNIILIPTTIWLWIDRAKYKDAIHKIDKIIEDLEPKPPPPRDPRKGMEWKIKR